METADFPTGRGCYDINCISYYRKYFFLLYNLISILNDQLIEEQKWQLLLLKTFQKNSIIY